MTSTEHVNDDGRPTPVTLDLSNDETYEVLMAALREYVSDTRWSVEREAEGGHSDAAWTEESDRRVRIARDLMRSIEIQTNSVPSSQEAHP